MSDLADHLIGIRDVAIEIQGHSEGTAEYDEAMARAQTLEKEMSAFIGSVVHGQNLTPEAVFSTGETASSFLEFIDVGLAEDGSAAQLAAVEVDFESLFATMHNPATCAHCQAASSPANDIGDTGAQQPYASTTYNGNGAGSVTATNTNSTTLEPLRMGDKWNVGEGDTLSYSYYDGSVPYDPAYNAGTNGSNIPGTPSGVDAAGAGNTGVLDEAFAAWDEAVSFEFDKVTESGSTVGDLRVAFTDTTTGAAAYAYGPGNSSASGDVYFETEDIDSNSNSGQSDFDSSGVGTAGFNYCAALHEIGHALGLSHPFDGGSVTGATLDLSLDNMRQTVMSYVQTDRNISFGVVQNGNSFSTSLEKIYASTPGMIDYQMMDELYGAEASSATTNGDNTYTFGANLKTIQTIADSGGTDTIDASAQTRDSVINLNAGQFSSIGIYSEADQKTYWATQTGLTTGQVQSWFDDLDASASAANSYYSQYTRSAIYTGEDNVGISGNTEIENAIGGSGDDTITGNNLANRITGGGGNDTIDGGTGDDIVEYSGAVSDYTITTSGGTTTIAHNNSGADGTDTVTNVEYFQFAAAAAEAGTATTSNVTAQDLSAATTTFDISVDGAAAVTVTAAQTDYTAAGGLTAFAADLQTKINAALAAASQTGRVSVTVNSPLAFESGTTGASSSIAFSNISADMFAALGVTDASGAGMTIEDGVDAGGPIYYDVAAGTTSRTAPTTISAPSTGGTTTTGGSSSGSSGGGGTSSTGSYRARGYPGTIAGIDLRTAAGARVALAVIDAALEDVSRARSGLGAVANRLEHAMGSMANQSVNMTAARSRIEDADMAVEMSKLVKAQILSQLAQYVIATAGRNAQGVLSMLN